MLIEFNTRNALKVENCIEEFSDTLHTPQYIKLNQLLVLCHENHLNGQTTPVIARLGLRADDDRLAHCDRHQIGKVDPQTATSGN